MRIKSSLFVLFFLLTACSRSVPENQWQYQASAMSQKYQEHFLQKKSFRAELDLSHARSLARQSAELSTLIDIELTSCAMELGVLAPHPCKNALELLILDPDPSQKAYFHLLTAQFSYGEISLLPAQYRDFAKAFLDEDTTRINRALGRIEPLSSRLVASALSREKIDEKNIQELIKRLSFKGYKNPLLSWLELQMRREQDPRKKARLKAKISVLTSD